MSKQKEIEALQKAIKEFKQLDDKAKHSHNEDDAYTNIWNSLRHIADGLDNDVDDSRSLSDVIDDGWDGYEDIENGDDMQDYLVERLQDENRPSNESFTETLYLLQAGAKAEYEDVLYVLNTESGFPRVREATADDIKEVVSQLVTNMQMQIAVDEKQISNKGA